MTGHNDLVCLNVHLCTVEQSITTSKCEYTLVCYPFVVEQTFRELYLQLYPVPSNSTTHVGLENGSGCVLFPKGGHPFVELVALCWNTVVAGLPRGIVMGPTGTPCISVA